MAVTNSENRLLDENTCGSLLEKLQEILDGSKSLDVYKRNVEQASKSRALLLQSLSDAKLELSSLLLALGENSFMGMAEVEVERLHQQKANRMKEIAFKKQDELEKIYAHAYIAAAKEEALSQKEILDKVEKWMSACEEESWLEDYNRGENKYNASKGAHLNLKLAEKASILVNKIPALVDILVAKTRVWEEAPDMSFTYDGVPLLAMLDEYAMLRHDHKKYQEQQNTDQEPGFGSRPSPTRPLGNKKVVGLCPNGGTNGTPRRLSLNAHQNGSRSSTKDGKKDNTRQVAPLNYVSISKEDAASHVSGTEPIPTSP
uniref:Uncharacterized protein n=1 Tax=Glycine max TaxID=3847 RepID=K7LA84_SOYBN